MTQQKGELTPRHSWKLVTLQCWDSLTPRHSWKLVTLQCWDSLSIGGGTYRPVSIYKLWLLRKGLLWGAVMYL